MKKTSPLLWSLLILPAVALIAGLGLFFWLSMQHSPGDGTAPEPGRPIAEQHSDRDNQSESISGLEKANLQVGADTRTVAPPDTVENASDVRFEADAEVSAVDDPPVPAVASEVSHDAGTDKIGNGQVKAGSESVDETVGEDSLPSVETTAEIDGPEVGDEEGTQAPDNDAESIENKGTELLGGRVIDQRGAPVAGLAVTASRRAENRSFSSTARTNANGNFQFRDIATGEYLLKTGASSTFPSISQFARSGATSTTLVVDRQYQIQVVGRVSSQNGQPIANAVVTASGGSAQTKSDASGVYRIAVVSTARQGFVLRYTAPGYIEDLQRVDIDTGATQVESNMVLRRLGNLSVTGQVLDPQISPVERALVQVTSQSRDFHESTQTDKDGQFVLTGLPPASDYRVKASSTDAFGVWSREGVEITSPVTFSITLPGVGSGRVVGSIVDLNQLPLPDFSLLAVRGGTDGRVVEFQSDSSGFFEINNFVANRLSFISRSEPSVQINGASVAEGDEVRLTLVVNVGAYEFSGSILSRSSHNPVGSARVTMTWQEEFDNLSSRVSHTTTSDSLGNFRFGNLGDGEWVLRIDADGYQTMTQPVKPATLSTSPAIFLENG